MDASKVKILFQLYIADDQLWDFYIRNDICEVGFGKETAVKPLKQSSLIIGAFQGERLVGIARAMFDGLSGAIMEFCLDLDLQGKGLKYENGSLIEKDTFGIGKRMGDILINELRKMGAAFIDIYIVEDCEEEFYDSIGLK
jgi:hypothetical protein